MALPGMHYYSTAKIRKERTGARKDAKTKRSKNYLKI